MASTPRHMCGRGLNRAPLGSWISTPCWGAVFERPLLTRLLGHVAIRERRRNHTLTHTNIKTLRRVSNGVLRCICMYILRYRYREIGDNSASFCTFTSFYPPAHAAYMSPLLSPECVQEFHNLCGHRATSSYLMYCIRHLTNHDMWEFSIYRRSLIRNLYRFRLKCLAGTNDRQICLFALHLEVALAPKCRHPLSIPYNLRT